MGGNSDKNGKMDKTLKTEKSKTVNKELEKIKGNISRLSEENLSSSEAQKICCLVLNLLENQDRIALPLLVEFLEAIEPLEAKIKFGIQTVLQSKRLKELSFALVAQKSEILIDLSPYRASLVKFCCLSRSEQVEIFKMKNGLISADRFLTSFDISFREYTSLLPKIELSKLFTEKHEVGGESYFLINLLDLKSIIVMTRILLFRHIELSMVFKTGIYDETRKFEALPFRIHGVGSVLAIFESNKQMFENLLEALYSCGEPVKKRQRFE